MRIDLLTLKKVEKKMSNLPGIDYRYDIGVWILIPEAGMIYIYRETKIAIIHTHTHDIPSNDRSSCPHAWDVY